MATAPATHIDESTLTKGQRRKLNALRKSVGDEIGAQAFAAWLSSQQAAGTTADANAAVIVDTLWPLVQQGTLSIPARRLPAQARARAHHRRTGTVVATEDAPRPPAPAAARSG